MIKNQMIAFKNKLQSDRGDSNTTSQLVWIGLAVVLAISVGTVIYNAVKAKSDEVADCITNSNMLVNSQQNAKCHGKTN